MVSTDQIKEILKGNAAMSADEIAEAIVALTGYACDTGDVLEALELLMAAGEVAQDASKFSLV